MCAKEVSSAKYSRQLLEAIEKVDGVVTSDDEVEKLAKKLGIENTSSKNSERCRTRSIIVIIVV
jgi:L-2-hydroxyglutarate oxidase LhgO